MRDGEAKVGMRVAFTARAKKVKGIILKGRDPGVGGMVTRIGMENQFGSECIRVHWDDNDVQSLNCYWVTRRGIVQIERERVDRRCGPHGPRKRVLAPKETA